MSRFRIKKQPLIAVAGIVWLLAGLNVAILGVRAAIDMRGLAAIVLVALAGGAVAIFCAFHPMFSKLVKKNAQRIADLEGERHHVVRFFDRKSYLMMAIMMSFGIGMRAAGLFPDWFIAFFYTGLGLALTLAGASYIARRARSRLGVSQDRLSVSRSPGHGLVNRRGRRAPSAAASCVRCECCTVHVGGGASVTLFE